MLDANQLFGEKSSDGTVILVLLPYRIPCSCYMVIPAGCTALITRQGKLVQELHEGGCVCLNPLFKCQYLVTNQHVTHFMIVKVRHHFDRMKGSDIDVD